MSAQALVIIAIRERYGTWLPRHTITNGILIVASSETSYCQNRRNDIQIFLLK